MQKPVSVVVGIGPGNGSSLSSRWAREGYQVALLSRNQAQLTEAEQKISGSKGFVCDATDPESVRAAYARVRAEMGSVDTLIYNAGSGVWGSLEELGENALTDSFQVNAVGLFLAAKQVLPGMLDAGKGTIAVIGASAAWRGRPKSLAFAAAKAAQRSIAQSLARDLGPRGIHVFYVVIDGAIDLPRTREMMKAKPDDFFLKPDDIALSVWNIAQQPKSAWTFEVDLRPFGESW
ncbi:MAG TPA: SDR family NAD(P)-dependent oxidoreductase [Polyangiaceae bacterium]|jgi:NAD(P)-dependent dehydrogenase (short-subunit alcohol dehydrogenase family)